MRGRAQLVLVSLLGLLACGDDQAQPVELPRPEAAGGAVATADAGGPTVPLEAWVDKMLADESAPDTVDDKIGVVIDTSDPSAFDKLLR